MFSITEFTENKYYIMTGSGEKWSDFDGPFDTAADACLLLATLAGEWASPELGRATLVKFQNNVLDLVKDDSGIPVNGNHIYWKTAIVINSEIVWEPE